MGTGRKGCRCGLGGKADAPFDERNLSMCELALVSSYAAIPRSEVPAGDFELLLFCSRVSPRDCDFPVAFAFAFAFALAAGLPSPVV